MLVTLSVLVTNVRAGDECPCFSQLSVLVTMSVLLTAVRTRDDVRARDAVRVRDERPCLSRQSVTTVHTGDEYPGL